MMNPLLRTLACSLLAVFAAVAPARAEEDCGDVERNYDLVKADAVSVQTNAALFAAADSGCELWRASSSTPAPRARPRPRGAMPLTHAAREGRLKLVALFLASGAPINARNVDGGTALFAAAEQPEAVDRRRCCWPKGADPNLTGRSGLTPLIAAAFAGNDRIVEELLGARRRSECARHNRQGGDGLCGRARLRRYRAAAARRRRRRAGALRQRSHRADVGRGPRRGRGRRGESPASSISCSLTVPPSTMPTIAAAPR